MCRPPTRCTPTVASRPIIPSTTLLFSSPLAFFFPLSTLPLRLRRGYSSGAYRNFLGVEYAVEIREYAEKDREGDAVREEQEGGEERLRRVSDEGPAMHGFEVHVLEHLVDR